MEAREAGLTVSVLTDPALFAPRAEVVIRRDPVACSVLATNLDAALRRGPHPGSAWIIVDAATDAPRPGHDGRHPAGPDHTRRPERADRTGTGPVAAAMLTPPHQLFLTPVTGAEESLVAGLLAAELADRDLPVPGVTGVVGPVTAFTEAWRQRTGRRRHLVMRQRMFELTELLDPGDVPGAARPATLDDQRLCLQWLRAFHDEAIPHAPVNDLARVVDGRLRSAGFTLWADGGRPVSLAGTSAPVAGVARIAPVYTPPELRRRGYAAAVTAAATRAGFAAGARSCMLYTDLANPTSNALYTRLGYHPVGDSAEYVFVR